MGRRRIHPEGATARERVAASTAALIAAGGARKTFRLSPEANAALRLAMARPGAPATETDLIAHLLVAHAEAERLRGKPRPSGVPKD